MGRLKAVLVQYGAKYEITRVTNLRDADEARGFPADAVLFARRPNFEGGEGDDYVDFLRCLSHSAIREVGLMETLEKKSEEEKVKDFLFRARHVPVGRASLHVQQVADRVTLTCDTQSIETTVDVMKKAWPPELPFGHLRLAGNIDFLKEK